MAINPSLAAPVAPNRNDYQIKVYRPDGNWDWGVDTSAYSAAMAAYQNALASYNDQIGAGYTSDQRGTQDLALETLRGAGAKDLASTNNAAEMAKLQAQIASQQGMATQAQAAEMARLQASQGGDINLATKQAQLTQETEQQRFLRAQQEQAQARAATDALLTRFGFNGGAANQNQVATGGQAVPGAVGSAGGGALTSATAMATDPADVAVENAAWARAKDKIGQVGEASKRDVAEQMSSRGLIGSGMEAQAMGQQATGTQGELANAATTQAMETLKRRYQVADRDASLASTKRGQDIGLVQTLSGGLTPKSGGNY